MSSKVGPYGRGGPKLSSGKPTNAPPAPRYGTKANTNDQAGAEVRGQSRTFITNAEARRQSAFVRRDVGLNPRQWNTKLGEMGPPSPSRETTSWLSDALESNAGLSSPVRRVSKKYGPANSAVGAKKR